MRIPKNCSQKRPVRKGSGTGRSESQLWFGGAGVEGAGGSECKRVSPVESRVMSKSSELGLRGGPEYYFLRPLSRSGARTALQQARRDSLWHHHHALCC